MKVLLIALLFSAVGCKKTKSVEYLGESTMTYISHAIYKVETENEICYTHTINGGVHCMLKEKK